MTLPIGYELGANDKVNRVVSDNNGTPDIDSDDTLQTDSDTIDSANKFNQERTKFQKGNQQGIRFASNDKNDDQLEIDLEDISHQQCKKYICTRLWFFQWSCIKR